jgi:acyl-CoA synthetase (AMP-forming)/AMP-acid ligase II
MPTLRVALEPSDKPAIVTPDQAHGTLSYSELAAAVNGARETLAATGLLKAQDAVSMSLINGVEFVTAFLAVGLHRCGLSSPACAIALTSFQDASVRAGIS